MIVFGQRYTMPCYEEGAKSFYLNQAAERLGVEIAKQFPFEKESGEFMTMKEFERDVMSNPDVLHPDQNFVSFKLEILATRRSDYFEFRKKVGSVLRNVSPDYAEQIRNLFVEFEAQENSLNNQHDTLKESEKR